MNAKLIKIIAPTLNALILRGVGALSTVLTSYIVTLNLEPNDAGYFFLFISIITFSGIAFSLGFNTLFIKRFATSGNRNVLFLYLKVGLFFPLFISTFFGIVSFFYADVISGFLGKSSFSEFMIYVSLGSILWSMNVVICSALQGFGKSNLFVVFQNIVPYFFVVVFGLYGVLNNENPNVDVYMDLMIFGLFTSFMFSLFIVVYSLRYFPYSKKVEKINLSDVPYFASSQLVQYILFSGVIIINVKNITLSDVSGLYISQRLTAVITIFLMVVNIIATPKFASLHESGEKEKLKDCVGKYSRLAFFISLPITLALMLFPSYILKVFGEHYVEYSYVLSILAAGNFFAILCGPVLAISNMTGNERYVALINAALIIPTFILGHFLSVTYGAVGLAITLFFVFIAQNYPITLRLKKVLGVYPILGGIK